MAPVGYIEILDAKSSVCERVPIEAFPIRIGRAYSNHIILSDPYVCPMHAEIALDERGEPVARDLDSVNGLRCDGRGKRVPMLALQSGTQFRVGHTQLRYCSIDHPLAPTVFDREGARLWMSSPLIAGALGLAIFLLLCLDAYLTMTERASVAGVVSEPLTTSAMLLLWAGLWALASRVVVSRFHFPQHVTIACGAVAGFFLLSTTSEWIEFLWPFLPALWLAGLLGSALIMAALVYGHLKFASALRRRSRIWAALAVSFVLAGVSAISDYAGRSKFSNVMDFTGVVKPIDARWLPTTTLDEFIRRSDKVKQELDALAQKARAAQP